GRTSPPAPPLGGEGCLSPWGGFVLSLAAGAPRPGADTGIAPLAGEGRPAPPRGTGTPPLAGERREATPGAGERLRTPAETAAASIVSPSISSKQPKSTSSTSSVRRHATVDIAGNFQSPFGLSVSCRLSAVASPGKNSVGSAARRVPSAPGP